MGLGNGLRKKNLRLADCIVGNKRLQYAVIPTENLTYVEKINEDEIFILVIDAQNWNNIAYYTYEQFLEIYDILGWEGFIA